MKFTQENIARSQKEREVSEKLRGEIDALLRYCANTMWNQFNNVNNAFNMRLNEANDAKNKLQAHLQSVCCVHLLNISVVSSENDLRQYIRKFCLNFN